MWPFKKKPQAPVDAQVAAVTRYQSLVSERLAKGVPRQRIWDELMAMKPSGLDELWARAEMESSVMGVMVDRNLQGRDLEKAGRADRAIVLYEANLADRFEGTHPYERLRIIYTKRGDYLNAIRVCDAHLAMVTERGAGKETIRELTSQIEKLRAKHEKAAG